MDAKHAAAISPPSTTAFWNPEPPPGRFPVWRRARIFPGRENVKKLRTKCFRSRLFSCILTPFPGWDKPSPNCCNLGQGCELKNPESKLMRPILASSPNFELGDQMRGSRKGRLKVKQMMWNTGLSHVVLGRPMVVNWETIKIRTHFLETTTSILEN